ncbi:hypothetical protein C4585_00780 [Candidatus Parcubacteria bacterium]|nr:MAG: hypothetical protein C4585_00780 [Candidatus Parcubacteria bacterium]
MPPKSGIEKIQKKKEKIPLKIDEYPLVQAILLGKTGENGVEAEFECERKYLPSRELSVEELEKLSGAHKRMIEQCYLKTDAGTVRLRKTKHESEEGELYRIAHKAKIADSEGKTEYQIKFPPNDARAQEFEKLWEKHDWNTVKKLRYYIPWKLPNGNMCEIHYDIHIDPENKLALDGFVRIEVEFKTDADALYAAGLHGNFAMLPDWVGQDVTHDERYGGKEIAKKGVQKESI